MLSAPQMRDPPEIDPGSAAHRKRGSRRVRGRITDLNVKQPRLPELSSPGTAVRRAASFPLAYDPLIHLLRKRLVKIDGCPDQVRA
jgi:hypothetical protein